MKAAYDPYLYVQSIEPALGYDNLTEFEPVQFQARAACARSRAATQLTRACRR